MKITDAVQKTLSPAAQAALKFLKHTAKDEVFTPQEIAEAAGCSWHHVYKALPRERGLQSFTRAVKGRRWWGRPEALDALVKML